MKKLWNKLSNLGVKSDMPIETYRKIILSNQLTILLFILLIFINLTFLIRNGLQYFGLNETLTFISIFSILSVLYLNHKGKNKYTSLIFSILVPFFTLIFSITSQSNAQSVDIVHYFFPRMLLVAEIIVPLVLIDSRNRAFLIIALIFNLLCLVGYDFVDGLIGKPFDPDQTSFSNYFVINYLIICPALLIILGFIFLNSLNKKYENKILNLNNELSVKNTELADSNEEIKAQRDQIADKNKQLEKAKQKIEDINKDLTDSILYAERIQRAILNEEKMPAGYFSDNFVFFRPRSIVSGDFYYYTLHKINNKKCIVVAAADCTGHGVPGGFLSMLGIAFLNEILQTDQAQNAAEILDLLRNKVKTTLKQTGKQLEQKDGMDIALCVYYPETRIIHFSGARNPMFVVHKNGEGESWKADRQPIGIHLKEKSFTNHEVKFTGGEMIYLFSDGIPDQYGGQDKKFLMKNLREFLIEVAPLPCNQQKEKVEKLMIDWMNPADAKPFEQTDDMLLMGLRIAE